LSVARERLGYPRAYWPYVLKVGQETGVDPYLILAVARQESTFRPSLASSAGAVGVMQVMPATAEHMVKTDPNTSPETGSNLESPLNSLRLGARYLRLMLDGSQGNIAFALASYNAGPGNCAKWRKQFAKADLETFIESIPFAETRDYVKIVLANYAAYYSLYPPADAKGDQ
jgi:soluble lytic murein transglycosylase